MKFKIKNSELKEAVKKCETVVGARHLSPILGACLIEVKNSSLTIKATDLDTYIKIDISNVEVVEDGVVAVDVKVLKSVLISIEEELELALSFKQEKQTLNIQSYNCNIELDTLNLDDFPVISYSTGRTVFSIKASELKAILNSVKGSMSTNEARYYINGVHIHTNKELNKLTFVATDGYRLAFLNKSIKLANNFTPCTTPRNLITVLSKVLKGHENITIDLLSTRDEKNSYECIVLSFNNVYIISKLIEGGFPDYKKVIPKNNDIAITFYRKPFINALKKARSKQSTSSLTSCIQIHANKELKLKQTGDSGHETEAKVALFTKEGKDLEIGFIYSYLFTTLRDLNSETVTIQAKDSVTPAIISGESNNELSYVLMPMRIM